MTAAIRTAIKLLKKSEPRRSGHMLVYFISGQKRQRYYRLCNAVISNGACDCGATEWAQKVDDAVKELEQL